MPDADLHGSLQDDTDGSLGVAGDQLEFAAALNREDAVSALIDRLVGSSTVNLADRIGLYRGNVRVHQRGALANAYPVLLALVGDEYFDALARAYAVEYPSQSGDLNRFGDALPSFIESYETDPRFAYFGDLACLEWALHVAHYAADVSPFSPADWAAVGDRLLDSRMAIHPACNAIASRHAIASIWLAHQPGGTFPRSPDVSSYALVVRPAWRATVLEQSEAAHLAFLALARGRTLNEALDEAFEVDESFDFATQWRTWIEASAIVGTLSDT